MRIAGAPTRADAQRLAELGMRPLWLSPSWSSATHGGGKDPVDDGWRDFRWIPPDEVGEPPGQDCNLGIMTGEVDGCTSPCVAVDLDTPAAMESALAALPPTPWRTVTGRGELWIYRHPGVRIPPGSLISGGLMDVFGDACQIVCSPSIHKSGRVYTEPVEWSPLVISSAPVFDPAWLVPMTSAPHLDALRDFVTTRVPPSRVSAMWLGSKVHSFDDRVKVTVRRALGPELGGAFDDGCRFAEQGASMSRPGTVPESVGHGLHRALTRATEAPIAQPSEPFTIHALTRRMMPSSDRAVFDLTLKHGDKIVEIARLSGTDMTSLRCIQGRALECGMVIGDVKKKEWATMLAAAMPVAGVIVENEQSNATSACHAFLNELLDSSKDATSIAEIKRGSVYRSETEVYIDGSYVVFRIRSALPVDRLDRATISAVVASRGMREKQPSIFGTRPRLWAFPLVAP